MTLGEGRNGLALPGRDTPLRLLLLQEADVDRERVRSLIVDQLPRAEVRAEASLESAMAQLAGGSFDVVLSDLTLSDATGDMVVRTVRTAHPDTPLVLLTGSADGDPAPWARSAGVQDCLAKGGLDGPRLGTALRLAMQRRQAAEQSDRYLQLARGLLDAWEVPTCAVDPHGTIVAVNQAWRAFTTANGGSDERCGVGVGYLEVCDRAASTDGGLGGEGAGVVADGIRQVLDGSREHFRHCYSCHAPEEDRWFEARVTPAVIKEGRGAVITHLDITHVREMQLTLTHRQLHDALTDLPNRALMEDRVEQALVDAERRGRAVALTHLDLNDFQHVNEHLGRTGGDAVLVQVAQRLRDRLRPGDTVARLDGDEFLVLWRDLEPAAAAEAVELSKDLLRVLEPPFEVGETRTTVSASVGVAVRRPGQSVEDLLRASDTALHEAKSRGPGQVVQSTEGLQESVELRRALEAELRLALEGTIDQLVLHYQPVLDLATGTVVAVEALVRWQHPRRGLLGPHLFVSTAETTGLIQRLGGWVLDRAIRDAVSLSHGGRELDVAVNISVRQLDDRFVDTVRSALASSGLRPSRLVLEITESALVDDVEQTAATLESLWRLGVRIAIDDFGTGYSSMLYLRRYPVTTLKVDREFVAGIGTSAEDEAICASITSLAKAVGASTVGEGIETADQYAVLRALGCVHGQGWLWSPAVPVEELSAAFAACDAVPVVAPRALTPPVSAKLRDDVTSLITSMHAEGASLHTIAAALNRTVGRHPRGVRWTARSVAQGLAAESGRTKDDVALTSAGDVVQEFVHE
ncbi:MAG: hypothetical protein JWP82_2120 [Humibacillus sp.]|nr:hypothetical protein [Humibacillus sp.]